MAQIKDKDPGGTFAKNIEKALQPFAENTEAKEALLFSLKDKEYSRELPPLIKPYSLPEYLEEAFTMQSDRYRVEIIQGIQLQECRFGIEPEITAKVSRTRCRIYEVGIPYAGRTYEEGKKIGWKDGIRALWCIFKYNLICRK